MAVPSGSAMSSPKWFGGARKLRLPYEPGTKASAATGVTTGALLSGVQYTQGGATTDSIVMRSRSGTVRRVVAQQSLAKLSALTGFEYT